MANFQVHLGVAFGVTAITSLAVYSTGIINNYDAIFLTSIGVIGGILPDIDSDNSTSILLVFSILALVFSVSLLFILLPILGILLSALISVFLFLGFRFGLMSLCRKFTSHRGAIHSPAFGLLCGLVLSYVANVFNQHLSILLGLFLFLGFLIHLVLDEIYAVDLQGGRLKKSFGTALTIFSFKRPGGYLVVYGLLIAAILTFPMIRDYQLTLQNISWHTIAQNLLPSVNVPSSQ